MSELQNLLGLSEKRVVITAGANGIGFAIAKKLYHLGAKIAICDIDQDSLSITSHVLGQCPAMAADVSNVAAIDAFFHQVQSQLGGLDALINNAGIAGPTIRVNAILPGIVEGKRMEEVISNRAQQVGVTYQEIETNYLKNISLRRMVTMENIADTVAFLLSDAACNLSGQSIAIDGNVETL